MGIANAPGRTGFIMSFEGESPPAARTLEVRSLKLLHQHDSVLQKQSDLPR